MPRKIVIIYIIIEEYRQRIELNVMKSFHQIFNELKKNRGLSNKQIASFTGVKLKEVKQWEAGTSFPIETKVIDALEGLLGTEISESLEGYSSQSKINSQVKTAEDLSLIHI